MNPPGKNVLKTLALTISPLSTSHYEAGIMNDGKGTWDQCYLNSPHLPEIMDSKAIEVLCRLPHQYHCNLIGQKAPNIPIVADVIGNLEVTWRSICPSSKMRMRRMPSLIKVGDGIWLYTIGQGIEAIPSSPTPSGHCRGILEGLWGAPGWT